MHLGYTFKHMFLAKHKWLMSIAKMFESGHNSPWIHNWPLSHQRNVQSRLINLSDKIKLTLVTSFYFKVHFTVFPRIHHWWLMVVMEMTQFFCPQCETILQVIGGCLACVHAQPLYMPSRSIYFSKPNQVNVDLLHHDKMRNRDTFVQNRNVKC